LSRKNENKNTEEVRNGNKEGIKKKKTTA